MRRALHVSGWPSSSPILVACLLGLSFRGAARVVQYLGLVMERWYFLADANHPQNLYYQRIS